MSDLEKLFREFREGDITKQEYIEKSYSQYHKFLFEYSDFINFCDIEEIRITRDGVQFLSNQDQIILNSPKNELRVAPIEILNFGEYEPEESKILRVIAARSSTILDIGANIGWFTIYFAKSNIEASIYAFEPTPEAYKYLLKNISENHIEERVSAIQVALADKDGKSSFFVAPGAGTNASLRHVNTNNRAVAIHVDTMRLDSWVHKTGVYVDMIKCDVEGAELPVLLGAKTTLENQRPVIFVELLRKWSLRFDYHPNDLILFLKTFNYSCFGVTANGLIPVTSVDEDTIETNYLFLDVLRHHDLVADLKLLG